MAAGDGSGEAAWLEAEVERQLQSITIPDEETEEDPDIELLELLEDDSVEVGAAVRTSNRGVCMVHSSLLS